MKLDDLITAFLKATTATWTNETYTSNRRKLNYLRSFIGGGDVDANLITSATVNGLREHLLSRTEKRNGGARVTGGLSPFTICTNLKTTKYFLEWSFRNGFIDHNPMLGVKPIKEPRAKPKAIATEDVVKLLEAAASNGEYWARPRNVALIFCLFDTGARVSGLANAELKNLNLEKGELLITDKGDFQHMVFLSPVTIQALRTWLAWRDQLGPVENTVFISKVGTRLTKWGIAHMLQNMAKLAGVLGRHNAHSFRHGFAKSCIENGIDLARLSQLMGHSSEAITAKYYARWETSELRKAHLQFSPTNGIPLVEPDDGRNEVWL